VGCVNSLMLPQWWVEDIVAYRLSSTLRLSYMRL